MQIVLKQMKQQNLVPPDADSSYVARYLRIIENNLAAKRKYTPGVYSGEVLLLQAQEPLPGLREDYAYEIQRSMEGWQCCSATLIVQPIPGNHVTIMSQPHVKVLADCLQQNLIQENP